MKKIKSLLIISQFFAIIVQAQWYTQQSGTALALYDIEFINRNTGWCSGNGVILMTTNGGLNWNNKLNDAPLKCNASSGNGISK